MFKSLLEYAGALIVSMLLFGCSSAKLKYSLDPEISYLEETALASKVISVKVIDGRKLLEEQPSSSDEINIAGPENIAKHLQTLIIAKLKQQGYKIGSNPLLADTAYELKLEELKLIASKNLLKSTLKASSKVVLTISKHSESFTKIFQSTRTQEVANPISALDATGVVNQLLSEQLAKAFSDPKFVQFASEQEKSR